MVERKTTLPSLPEEIILEILYFLPVRSLLRFLCVSKSWRLTISSTDFAESHLQMSVRCPNLNSRLLIFSPFYVKSINHHELSPPCITTELDHPFENHDPAVYIAVLGTCNGLVCLVVDDNKFIILYNPSTRHYRSILLWNSLFLPPETFYSYRGICFDSDLHEYIVVRNKSTRPCIDNKFEVELLSIKEYAHQPTTVRKLSCDFAEGSIHSTLFFNGSFHFLVHRHNRLHCQRKKIIVRLDFAREVFDEVPEPDVCNASDGWAKLKVLGGYLSLISRPHPIPCTESIDIWVMKEYGVKTSWTKLLSIPTTCYVYVEPVHLKSDREILLAVSIGYCRELSIFNSEESSFEKVFTDNDSGGFVTAVYVESLISPRMLKTVKE